MMIVFSSNKWQNAHEVDVVIRAGIDSDVPATGLYFKANFFV